MEVRPTIYFSVPKIYQQFVARVESRPDEEARLLHPELRFVFTAAAALPAHLAAFFAARRLPVIEGWGLTETAPCCTLTDLVEPRTVQGMVGYPIPGVRVRIAPDGEIHVHGPNVMLGYFDEPESTGAALPGDGWFRTGDLGALEGTGLRLISRRDRVFKLANAEKVIPTSIELRLAGMNAYIRHVIVVGSGRDYPAAIVFPDFYRIAEEFGDDREAADRVVKESIRQTVLDFNRTHPVKYEHIQAIAVVSRELSIERNELTPSLKVRVGHVLDGAWEYIAATYEPSAECDCRYLRKILRVAPDQRLCFTGKGRTLDECHACGSFIFDDDATARPDILGGTVT
jgi:long-chain acyl-CoA synthetase